ncbi:MAG: lipocalin family protein [Halofilum sp. (in: g-proteobacteria)]|nr:lipocalin family protein [Halofilum sp. (in: g-proteobacteria)]
MKRFARLFFAAGLALALGACSVMPPQEFPRAERVDLERYMGTWYVIAHIPARAERNAYNAIERYEQVEPGVIATVFTFREGAFDGEAERMEPTGYVLEGTGNAVWAMQFFWPLRFEFTISHVSPDYDTTIIARSARDLVWIMARTPMIPESTYDDLVARVASLGYDVSKLRRVPQQPLDQRDDG